MMNKGWRHADTGGGCSGTVLFGARYHVLASRDEEDDGDMPPDMVLTVHRNVDGCIAGTVPVAEWRCRNHEEWAPIGERMLARVEAEFDALGAACTIGQALAWEGCPENLMLERACLNTHWGDIVATLGRERAEGALRDGWVHGDEAQHACAPYRQAKGGAR
jgi:hypothetical protein